MKKHSIIALLLAIALVLTTFAGSFSVVTSAADTVTPVAFDSGKHIDLLTTSGLSTTNTINVTLTKGASSVKSNTTNEGDITVANIDVGNATAIYGAGTMYYKASAYEPNSAYHYPTVIIADVVREGLEGYLALVFAGKGTPVRLNLVDKSGVSLAWVASFNNITTSEKVTHDFAYSIDTVNNLLTISLDGNVVLNNFALTSKNNISVNNYSAGASRYYCSFELTNYAVFKDMRQIPVFNSVKHIDLTSSLGFTATTNMSYSYSAASGATFRIDTTNGREEKVVSIESAIGDASAIYSSGSVHYGASAYYKNAASHYPFIPIANITSGSYTGYLALVFLGKGTSVSLRLVRGSGDSTVADPIFATFNDFTTDNGTTHTFAYCIDVETNRLSIAIDGTTVLNEYALDSTNSITLNNYVAGFGKFYASAKLSNYRVYTDNPEALEYIELGPIYQSLDFGDYPIDFDGGATIDNIYFENGENYRKSGTHTLVYDESDTTYIRELVLYRLGDINTDNTTNILDFIALTKKLSNVQDIDSAGKKAADINLNDTIETNDLVMLKKNLLLSADFVRTGYTSNDMENLVDFTVEVESGRDVRVLQLTDTQIIESEQQRYDDRLGVGSSQYNRWLSTNKYEMYHKYVTQSIENYKPDFIIITGDIIYGEFDDSGAALLEFIEFMDSFKIPWAPVFGNHENESYKGVDWQCEQLENSEYCLFKQRTLTGNGNYTVGLKQDGKYKRVFFMLDSNGCGAMSSQSLANGHSKMAVGFGEDQIEWYTDLAEKMRYAEPDLKLSAAFHIQLSVFTKAYAKYGFTNSDTINNPINIDALENVEETDFGYIGRDLKSAWDTDENVWYSLKNSGFDSIYVGHEHCNSASVVYRGVRFQYGQKSSTYDRANYLKSDGTIVGSYSEEGTPIIGGTTIPLNQDGSLGIGELLLYETPEEPEEPEDSENIAYTETYDFNGTDFDTSATATGVCLKNFSANLISDTSSVPTGFSNGVYGNTNVSNEGMATFSATFAESIDASKVASLKVRMYVKSYTPTSGKTPLIRIFTNEVYDTMVSSVTFESLGGVYDEWCEIDIWPLIKDTSIINNNTLTRFVMTYRYYTSDTTAKCYYDSFTFGYSEIPN